jgi:TRAP-type C4-dicarboxylate transport system permease small subunit
VAAPHDPPSSPTGHHLPPDFPAPVRALAALSRALALVEGAAIGLALVSLIVLALWQSVSTTLHRGLMPSLPEAPGWTNNVLRHSVFIIGFVGAMFATYTARHLRVDAVTRLAGVRARLALRIVGTGAAMAVCADILYWTNVFRLGVLDEVAKDGDLFTASRGAMVLMVGVGGMLFHFFVQAVIDATYLVTGREVPDWWIAEASHGGEVLVQENTDAPEMAP